MPADCDPLELAARALKHRDRSRNELDRRLEEAGIDASAREQALETLERIGYLDDRRFAATRAHTLAERGYGDEAIRVDLDREGVTAETAEAAVRGLEPEPERARSFVRRLGGRGNAAAQLLRRGFDPDSVEAALGADIAPGSA
ncbi:MAG TPA: RecX family transcriptional regulator [Gaiellaceae bacterium]|nr:RecX family transcriptional regulator [Gaiellaceae bacterium]